MCSNDGRKLQAQDVTGGFGSVMPSLQRHLSELRRIVDEWVILGNNSRIEGIGRGTVKMKVGIKIPEHKMTLCEALVVPDLSAILFSPIKATAQKQGL